MALVNCSIFWHSGLCHRVYQLLSNRQLVCMDGTIPDQKQECKLEWPNVAHVHMYMYACTQACKITNSKYYETPPIFGNEEYTNILAI